MREPVQPPKRLPLPSFLLIVCSCLASLSSFADLPGPSEFNTKTWDIDDGLAHGIVNTGLQDAKGYLWFATNGGLTRFDGLKFDRFAPPKRYRTYGFNIRGIAEDPEGGLLVVPAGNFLLRFKRGTWSEHPLTSEIQARGGSPTGVYVGSENTIWVSTLEGELLCLHPQHGNQHFSIGINTIHGDRSTLLVSDLQGGHWAIGNGVHWISQEGDITSLGQSTLQAQAIGPAAHGKLWVLAGDELSLFESTERLYCSTVPSELDSEEVQQLFEDRGGRLWLASRSQGLLCMDVGKLIRPSSFSSINRIWQDFEGGIWAATAGGGVERVSIRPFKIFDSKHGLSEDFVSSVAEDNTGRVWLANQRGGLRTIETRSSQPQAQSRDTAPFAGLLKADRKGQIWFVDESKALKRLDPKSGQLSPLLDPPEDVHVLFLASNGDLWFAADPNTAGYYRNDEIHYLSPEDGELTNIRSITEDPRGNVWLGGRPGILWKWSNEELISHGTEEGLEQEAISSLLPDSQDRLWICTANGLVLKEGKQFHHLGQHAGLAEETLKDVLDDGLDRLWFSSGRGILYANKSEFLQATRNPGYRLQANRLGADFGLRPVTPAINLAPTALKASDGNLWFATSQGAVVLDPRQIPSNQSTPKVLIDSLSLDGHPLNTHDDISFHARSHRIDFQFSALTFTAPDSLSMRHKLDGFDETWVDTSSDRSASYPKLPSGNYTMLVTARNPTGTWSEPARITITVQPYWWETPAARGALGLAILVATILTVRVFAQRRIKIRLQKLEHESALERERNRIARDLHDDLGAGLTEVGLLADRLVSDSPEGFSRQLTTLASRTRHLATDLSSIVWTMNAQHASLDLLTQFIQRYAERLFRNTGIHCVIEGLESMPSLSLQPGVQHHILSATKEALNNVLKHAKASEVQILFQYSKNEFIMQLQDNGVGYQSIQTDTPEGNGLRNMSVRMDEIGGRLETNSELGRGTTIAFHLNFDNV